MGLHTRTRTGLFPLAQIGFRLCEGTSPPCCGCDHPCARCKKIQLRRDVALRAPILNRKELGLLARVGAMNSVDVVEHRRDALWQVERAGKLEARCFVSKANGYVKTAKASHCER
jgi:hypothetical protein